MLSREAGQYGMINIATEVYQTKGVILQEIISFGRGEAKDETSVWERKLRSNGDMREAAII